ncbi:ATP-binding protein [Pseudofrankia inefficax]|uniref:Orc1-like AAA ATPase domain-containing protein n=1 Tax=Pseudofrankia inefficax (strain DSM 45817 / CECT 9037 / DDB 130130 / EuI1c) TaxID=298654 RepID=E3J547_PSEI1|nr:ATP-binding protein [Pseudofrankia inefficax]ADP79498.1 hypothetical protein FraEuI1c_1432 [Pseudofrankia inefficax]
MDPDVVDRLGAELAAGLGEPAARALTEWAAQEDTRFRLDRWLVNGKTNAVLAVVEENDDLAERARKLVLKLDRVPAGDAGTSEYARARRAIKDSPEFARVHLAAPVRGPVRVGDGTWLAFQEIAGHDPTDYRVLAALFAGMLGSALGTSDGVDPVTCDPATFVATCRRLVDGVLVEWARQPKTEVCTSQHFLRAILGNRLAPGQPLHRLASELPRDRIDLEGEPESLPNPFALAMGAAPGPTLSMLLGRCHADLHSQNVLVRVNPAIDAADYVFVDLAKYESAGPLVRDPVHLVLYVISRAMPTLSAHHRDVLLDVLVRPANAPDGRGSFLPLWLGDLVNGVWETGESWIREFSYGPEWRQQRLLALLACALIFYGRESTAEDVRPWFLRLAARCASVVGGDGWGVGPTTAGTQPGGSAADGVPAAGVRASGVAANASSTGATPRSRELSDTESYMVGRGQELQMLGELVSGTSDQRLVNIYGPGGIGKSEVCRAFLRQERAALRGVVTSVDLNRPDLTPNVILRDLTEGLVMTARPDDDRVRSVLAGVLARLDEHAFVSNLVDTSGGIDAMFDVLGRPLDEATLARATAAADVDAAVSPMARRALGNRFALDRYLRGAERDLARTFAAALATAFEDESRPVVMLLDTYEEIGSLDDWLCRRLVPELPQSARLVLFGRNQLTKENLDWADYGDSLRMQPLPELAEDDAKTFLRHHGLSDPTALDEVYRFTGGYPLLLVLVRLLARESGSWSAIGEMRASGNRDRVASRLLDRILREQRAAEVREVLEKCAVASWIDPEIIATLLEIGSDEARGVYEKIQRHSFMEPHPFGVRLHDKIRELLVERMRFTSESEYQRLDGLLTEMHRARARIAQPKEDEDDGPRPEA